MLQLEQLHYTPSEPSYNLKSFVSTGTNALGTSTMLSTLQVSHREEQTLLEQTTWVDLLSNTTNISYDIDERKIDVLQNFTPGISLQQVQQKFNLNSEQFAALILISVQIQNPELLPVRLFITGEAGTGKSQVIHAIIYYFTLAKMQNKLLCTASTGTAAAKIGGSTIHSALKLRTKSLSKTSPSYRDLLCNLSTVKFLIIDEVSMISAGTLWRIHERLQMIYTNEEPFGGVNMLFFGDFNQFPPVLGKPLYCTVHDVEIQSNSKGEEALGTVLWTQLTDVVILKENYRQQTDSRWLGILRHLLEGSLIAEDIKVLKSRLLSKHTPSELLPVVVNRNLLRTKLNSMIISKLQQNRNPSNFLMIPAKDSCNTRDITHPDLSERLKQMQDNDTESLPGYLHTFSNAKYLITANINTSLGLANGTPCELYSLPNTTTDNYLLVKVYRDLPIQFDGLPNSVVPIYRSTKCFTVKEGSKTVQITRNQFPLIPAYSITDYKSQGATMKNCIVDLRKPPGTCKHFHSLYVMLSRVATLNGLYVLCEFTDDDLQVQPPPNLKKEIARLESLHNLTITKAKQNRLYQQFCTNI